jgi:SAM-dependent methyltransferase
VTDQTTRFTGRVEDYVKARPTYPRGVLPFLRDSCGLRATSVVADLGSGTGLFTQLLLESGATVNAVEPNDEMRAAAEKILGGEPRFKSVAGRAEATTLADASVNLVTAAQAFHWFDAEAARVEIARIVRPPASDAVSNVALVWNDRDAESTPFLREYEELMRVGCPKYLELQGKAKDLAKFDRLLGRGRWARHTVANVQHHDREGLVERLLSSSYAPRAGEPRYEENVAELNAMFDRYAENGTVAMKYTTVLIVGRPQ